MRNPQITLAALAVVASLVVPRMSLAQDCQSLSGPARTDCYIGRARIQGAKATVAKDRARVGADVEYLRAATGISNPLRAPAKKSKRKPRSR